MLKTESSRYKFPIIDPVASSDSFLMISQRPDKKEIFSPDLSRVLTESNW